MGRIIALGLTAIFGLIMLSIAFGSWYTVDQGYRAVLLRNGALVGTAQPGFNFKMPWIDSAIDISVQEHVKVYGVDSTATSDPSILPGLAVYTYDQQTAGARVSVNYTIPAGEVDQVYVKFGGEDGLVSRILDPRVYKSVKESFGKFTAARAIQEREVLAAMMLTTLQQSVVGEPIQVLSIQIENVEYTTAFEKAISDQVDAEIEVKKVKQNAEKEKITAQITVIKAQAEADAVLANAKASAQATILKGDAEGKAIRAKGEALKDNPALVALISAEKWNGILPTTMLPGSAVPFVDVNK